MSDSDLCYKSCGEYIVTMKKLPDTQTNESRKDVVNTRCAKFRANKLLVVDIQHKHTGEKIDRIQNTSYQGRTIWYIKSEVITVSDYDQDLDRVCTTGIHYFLSRERAFYWDLKVQNGPYRNWHENGQKKEECTYQEGKLHGPFQSWYSNGKKREECTYKEGKLTK